MLNMSDINGVNEFSTCVHTVCSMCHLNICKRIHTNVHVCKQSMKLRNSTLIIKFYSFCWPKHPLKWVNE
jgi:hypothetical protein